MFMYCFNEGEFVCLVSSALALTAEASETDLSVSFSFFSFFATIVAISSGISVLSLNDCPNLIKSATVEDFSCFTSACFFCCKRSFSCETKALKSPISEGSEGLVGTFSWGNCI